MRKPTVLFISSIGTAGKSGGALQMKRHFVTSGDFSTVEFVGGNWDPIIDWTPKNRLLRRLTGRLSRTRLRSILLLLALTCRHGDEVERLLQSIQNRPKPDFVATIACGRYQFLALEVAKRLRLPLVSFFHDWWPDLVFPHGSTANRILQKSFLSHYRRSDLPLCVSSAMRDMLPSNSRARILLPIGQDIAMRQPRVAVDPVKSITIGYLGSLHADIGECLRILANFMLRSPIPGITLKCYGANPSWPTEDTQAFRTAGLYDEADRNDASPEELMSKVDLILVPTSFAPLMRRRVETSFPSKLLDALPYGSPILSWGPSYSCSHAFVRANNLGCVVTSPSPAALASSAIAFARSYAYQTSSLACLNLFEGDGSPGEIHRQFLCLLRETLDKGA